MLHSTSIVFGAGGGSNFLTYIQIGEYNESHLPITEF